MTKYCRTALNKKTSLRVFHQFGDQAQSIDISWSFPEGAQAAPEESKKAFKRMSNQGKEECMETPKAVPATEGRRASIMH